MSKQLRYQIMTQKDKTFTPFKVKGKNLIFKTWTEADVALNKLGEKGTVISQVNVDV